MCFLSKVVLAAVVLLCSWSPPSAVAEQPMQVATQVVKVGNLIITQADIDLRVQTMLPMQVSFHGQISAEKIAKIKREALEELIVRAYKVQSAINEEISIDGAAFESEWQKRLSKKQQQAARMQPAQLSKIKADLYLDQLARKAESVAVDAKVTVTDQEVAAYYTKNKAKYFRPKLFTASHVFIKVDPADNAEEKAVKLARAEELFKRARTGEDFFNLAYYESDDRSKYVGGSLGSFHAGQTVREFDVAIQTMQPGEIVGPIRTLYGFHIIKLDTVEEERQLQFEEVSAKIRTSLVETEREGLYSQWMTKLKEEYPLQRFAQ